MLSRARLETWASDRTIRLTAATLLALMHLAIFSLAGHVRLGRAFNSSSEPPAFTNPRAFVLGGYPREPAHWSRLIVSRWDAQIYIGFAIRGLSACPTDKSAPDWQYMQCGLAWMPAYGMLGGNVASVTHLPPDYTLMLISVIAAIIVNFFWTSRVITDRIGSLAAWGTLVAFNAYPSAFYMVAPYTEALTLALSLGGFWFMTKDRWAIAGGLIGAASAFRATGIAFSAALGFAAIGAARERRIAKDPRWWRPLLAAPLSIWGLVAELIMFKLWVGDALAYVRARKAFGDVRIFSRLWSPQFYLRGFTAQHMDMVMVFGMLAIILIVGRELLRNFKREERVFLIVSAVVGMLMVIPTVHEYWGINRYLLMCPLGFLAAGVLARRKPALFCAWLILCAWMYWHVEMCSYVAHGNPEYCPCLGRVEWSAPFDS